MRVSSSKHFYKPWGRIIETLNPGTYIVNINNNYNASQYNSNKHFRLSSVGLLGAQNYTIPIVMFVFGIVYIVGCIIFLIMKKRTGGKFGPKIL
jgi:hypothetical protein